MKDKEIFLNLLRQDENDSETTLYFDNVLKASNMKENINNAIKLANVKELIVAANEIIKPLPYNYKNAMKSGWVE